MCNYREGLTIDNQNRNTPPRRNPQGADDKTRYVSAQAPRTPSQGSAGRGRQTRKKESFGKRFAIGALKFIAVFMCFGVILASVAAVAVSMYVVKETQDDASIIDLDNLKLSYTSIVYARDQDNPGQWVEYQRLDSPDENRIWADWGNISDKIKNAYKAIEDNTFDTHNGINFKRTIFAMLNELANKLTGSYLRGNQQGASTIDQQLIKNITSETESQGIEGYLRKIREIFRAIALDNRYSKEQIFEAYLNTIDLTGTIGGVEAGANRYFNKTAADVSYAEAASIAAITKNPTTYSPITNPELHLARRNKVLENMFALGYIPSQEELDTAKAEPLHLFEEVKAEDAAVASKNSYFTDSLITEVLSDFQTINGLTQEEANKKLFSGGMRIYATVVPSLQTTIENLFAAADPTIWDPAPVENWVPVTENGAKILNADGTEPEPKTISAQAAGVIINYKGELCAVAGGLGQKTGDRTLNRAVDSVRQVGSTMKPVAAYPLAIEYDRAGYSTTQYDSPLVDPTLKDEKGNVLSNWPKNYGGGYTNAPMTTYQALKLSINTVAVKYGNLVGAQDMFDFASNTLEISSLDAKYDVGLGPMVLGSMTHGISPYELAGAFMMYGNGGEFYSLHSYESITDARDNIVLEPEINHVQAISSNTAYIMNRLLQKVMTDQGGTGYGQALKGGMDSIGKTGTSNKGDISLDVWFVGLTPYYIMSTWYGYDESAVLKQYRAGASRHPGIKAWKQTVGVEQENEARYPIIEFAVPDNVVQRAFCTSSGKAPTEGCPTATGWYKTDMVDRQLPVCSGHSA